METSKLSAVQGKVDLDPCTRRYSWCADNLSGVASMLYAGSNGFYGLRVSTVGASTTTNVVVPYSKYSCSIIYLKYIISK